MLLYFMLVMAKLKKYVYFYEEKIARMGYVR